MASLEVGRFMPTSFLFWSQQARIVHDAELKHQDSKWVRFQAFLRQEEGTQRQLCSQDTCQCGRGLPHEGVGVTKFGMSLTIHKNTSWQDFLGKLPGYPRKIAGISQNLRVRDQKV